jgi:hypothetical protein
VRIRICQIANDSIRSLKYVTEANEIDDAFSKEQADVGSSIVMFAKGSTLDASREDVRGLMCASHIVVVLAQTVCVRVRSKGLAQLLAMGLRRLHPTHVAALALLHALLSIVAEEYAHNLCFVYISGSCDQHRAGLD